jgi:hypothetical protein
MEMNSIYLPTPNAHSNMTGIISPSPVFHPLKQTVKNYNNTNFKRYLDPNIKNSNCSQIASKLHSTSSLSVTIDLTIPKWSSHPLDSSISQAHIQHIQHLLHLSFSTPEEPISSCSGQQSPFVFHQSFYHLLSYGLPIDDYVIYSFLNTLCKSNQNI